MGKSSKKKKRTQKEAAPEERYRGIISDELEHILHYAGAETHDFLVSEDPVTIRVQTPEQLVLLGWYARGQVFGDLLVSDMELEAVEGEYRIAFQSVYLVDPFEGAGEVEEV